MNKITIYNIENGNEIVATFETRKRKDLQDLVIAEIKRLNSGYCVFIQGTMKTLDSDKNNCLLGGNLWWTSKNGKYQFSIN